MSKSIVDIVSSPSLNLSLLSPPPELLPVEEFEISRFRFFFSRFLICRQDSMVVPFPAAMAVVALLAEAAAVAETELFLLFRDSGL